MYCAEGLEFRILLDFDVFKATQLPSLSAFLFQLLPQQQEHARASLVFAGASSNLILSLLTTVLYCCSSCVLIKIPYSKQ